jgi:hypothetical protein
MGRGGGDEACAGLGWWRRGSLRAAGEGGPGGAQDIGGQHMGWAGLGWAGLGRWVAVVLTGAARRRSGRPLAASQSSGRRGRGCRAASWATSGADRRKLPGRCRAAAAAPHAKLAAALWPAPASAHHPAAGWTHQLLVVVVKVVAQAALGGVERVCGGVQPVHHAVGADLHAAASTQARPGCCHRPGGTPGLLALPGPLAPPPRQRGRAQAC